MPRIDAPTVAEHHRLRRASLIAAGRRLLATTGGDAVTPAAVGAAAGIARSSVYQYFESSGDLLAAIVEDAFASATARISEAVASVDEPHARIEAYLAVALDLGTDSEHRMFDGIDPATLPPATRARIAALHREQIAPLLDAVRDSGAPDPELAAQLIGGMLSGAARAVAGGAARATVLDALISAVHDGPVPRATRP